MDVHNAAEAETIFRTKFLSTLKHDFVVLETQEHDFGWLFLYTTRRYVETKNPSTLVPGSGPVVVLRNGDVVPLTTSAPPDMAIAAFEADWRKAQGR